MIASKAITRNFSKVLQSLRGRPSATVVVVTQHNSTSERRLKIDAIMTLYTVHKDEATDADES